MSRYPMSQHERAFRDKYPGARVEAVASGLRNMPLYRVFIGKHLCGQSLIRPRAFRDAMDRSRWMIPEESVSA